MTKTRTNTTISTTFNPAHLATLEARHRNLDDECTKLHLSPSTSDAALQEAKRLKLKAKGELEQYRALKPAEAATNKAPAAPSIEVTPSQPKAADWKLIAGAEASAHAATATTALQGVIAA